MVKKAEKPNVATNKPKKNGAKSKKDEQLKLLKEINDELLEVNTSIKQIQNQIDHLQSSSGKFKMEKINSADSKLKDFNKRRKNLEKEAMAIFEVIRGLSSEEDLKKECEGLKGVAGLLTKAEKVKKVTQKKEKPSKKSKPEDQPTLQATENVEKSSQNSEDKNFVRFTQPWSVFPQIPQDNLDQKPSPWPTLNSSQPRSVNHEKRTGNPVSSSVIGNLKDSNVTLRFMPSWIVEKTENRIKLEAQKKLSEKDQQLKLLKPINEELLEVSTNIKQTQNQLSQLKSSKGKNKREKIEAAEMKLKDLKKNRLKLENKSKAIFGVIRGLDSDVDLLKECEEMKGIAELLSKSEKFNKVTPKNEEKSQTPEKEEKPTPKTPPKQENSPKNVENPPQNVKAGDFVRITRQAPTAPQFPYRNPQNFANPQVNRNPQNFPNRHIFQRPQPFYPTHQPSRIVKNSNGFYTIRNPSFYSANLTLGGSSPTYSTAPRFKPSWINEEDSENLTWTLNFAKSPQGF